MISSNDFYIGVAIQVDSAIYTVVDFQHVKPGKGAAFVRTRLKNIRTGGVVEMTFRAGEKVPKANVERSEMQFLFGSGDDYTFMNNSTYEQLTLPKEKLGNALNFLKEGMNVVVAMFGGNEVVGIELPNSVVLEVTETEPGLKGATAAGSSKPATLETGAVVNVPVFINIGDKIKVDTRSGQYLERA